MPRAAHGGNGASASNRLSSGLVRAGYCERRSQIGGPSRHHAPLGKPSCHRAPAAHIAARQPEDAPATASEGFITCTSLYSMSITPRKNGSRNPAPLRQAARVRGGGGGAARAFALCPAGEAACAARWRAARSWRRGSQASSGRAWRAALLPASLRGHPAARGRRNLRRCPPEADPDSARLLGGERRGDRHRGGHRAERPARVQSVRRSICGGKCSRQALQRAGGRWCAQRAQWCSESVECRFATPARVRGQTTAATHCT